MSTTWDPGPRPPWVDAVNRGDVLPMTEVARRPFTIDALLAEASLLHGDDVPSLDDAAIDGLRVLVNALETEANLTLLGRWITRRFLLRLITVRRQLDAYAERDRAVHDEVIVEPIFVTGAPRTGTTMLHALLASDTRHRVPYGWELLWPLPPPELGGDVAMRRSLANDELGLPQVVAPHLLAIHEYGADLPKECLSLMSFAFRSEEFISRYRVPSYVAWLQRADLGPAYDVHRAALQVLQRRQPTARWVLKSPVHMHNIDDVLAVYPDARIVVTHRDPLTVLASVTSLVATLRWVHSDAVDLAEIGAYHADLYLESLDRLSTRTYPDDRVVHVQYADLARDPVATVRDLYRRMDIPFPEELAMSLAGTMRERPRNKHGGHEYSFTDLALDVTAARTRASRYQRVFGVADELR